MKSIPKILPALALFLGLSLPAAAASLPEGGLYVNKDGTPITADQIVPPSTDKTKMAPQDQAVIDAMKALPHDTATTVTVTVNEDGAPVSPQVTESSGSIILDQYALDCVNLWHFHPAKMGDRTAAVPVSIPIRFVSTMVAVAATPETDVLKDMTDKERTAAENAGHPALSCTVYVTSTGTVEGEPEVQKPEDLSSGDFKVLEKYAKRCLSDWTFTPAQNPDGEAIGTDTVVTVQC